MRQLRPRPTAASALSIKVSLVWLSVCRIGPSCQVIQLSNPSRRAGAAAGGFGVVVAVMELLPVVAAAPGHVNQVRRSLLDALTRDQHIQLRSIGDALLSRLDPDGRMTALYDPPPPTEPAVETSMAAAPSAAAKPSTTGMRGRHLGQKWRPHRRGKLRHSLGPVLLLFIPRSFCDRSFRTRVDRGRPGGRTVAMLGPSFHSARRSLPSRTESSSCPRPAILATESPAPVFR